MSEAKSYAEPVYEFASQVDNLVESAKISLEEFMKFDQEAVNKIIKNMAIYGQLNHKELAKYAVQETGRGVYEDKMIKNTFATENVYYNIKNAKTVGIIEENDHDGYAIIADPVGVICAVTPVTNPTSTVMFKAIIALKSRNPIIFGFHPSAQKCSAWAAKIMYDAAIAAGAPKNCIGWIEEPSIENTNALMNHPGVSLILATGGPGMVKSAYSAGKPALGVGAGNVPCYIEKSANLKRAVNDLILSKTFDNGMICASEQAVIVDEEIFEEFKNLMEQNGCYFVNEEEKIILESVMYNYEKHAISPDIVGQSAIKIANMAGIYVPDDTKILIVRLDGIGPNYPLSREKLSPVLACYCVFSIEEGLQKSESLIEFGGLGHSAVIHSENEKIIKLFSKTVKAGRVIVNSPSTHGAIGDIYNTGTPSLTLGCGSYGSNSTTSNVSTVNLLNLKRVSKRRKNMQWFKIPSKIYFEENSIQYLESMENISKAFIVTDKFMVDLGYVDRVMYYLQKRKNFVHCETFSNIEPDPSLETILKGTENMNAFGPDTIIAIGGGSVIDAAKGMWLFYEQPCVDFQAMSIKFMDIRKRAYNFPTLGKKANLVAIPTTSGTGSEVTSFSVISDKVNNMKYPIADYNLTPNVAIIDPNFVYSLPQAVVADTGLDVLTHAIESYVSVLASDFTDALAMKAIQLVFEYLPRSYNGEKLAKEKMHNASTIAGMAFTNAFLGIGHSLAHKIGGEFHVPHGRANAVLLPYIISYNAQKPTKFTAFPKYEKFIADEKYAEISKMLGYPASTVNSGVESLIWAVSKLMATLNMPKTFRECGIAEHDFMSKVSELAEKAYGDQCTNANPRMPLISELEQIYINAY
ncbi:MAG: bifunctional acetaldehyde-CoA/alcohol dehydrogenase [Clostridiales bacterium]|jgi:acetaldehyde dehydrogenase/alcohol dehydrogenase|nr:bifunctional acetaldehyde-CoA/alcohol dehydrogenase [Clostridiales bacterium]